MATPTSATPHPDQTTVTVTSFYLAPTASSSPDSSVGNGGPSKKFAALASGAAIGGFAATCIIGWILFQVWKKRHPHIWHVRTDEENFPGWRRSTVQKLYETNPTNNSTSRDTTEKNSEIGYSNKSEDISQIGLGRSVTLSNAPTIPLPVMSMPSSPIAERGRRPSSSHLSLATTPDLMHEYTAALAFEDTMNRAESRLSHTSRRSLSPSDNITPYVTPIEGPPFADISIAGAGPPNDRDGIMMGSEASSAHSHSQSQHTHHSQYSYHYQRSTSAMSGANVRSSSRNSGAPSPGLKNQRSNSQQSVQPSVQQMQQVNNGSRPRGATSSSWHGHTMFTMPGSHSTWNGFPLASSPPIPQNQPPTAWNAGGVKTRRASSSSVQQSHSPPQTYFNHNFNSEQGHGRPQVRRGSSQSTPPMFFISQSPDQTSEVRPPSPLEDEFEHPKRRLTCTNPDETKSLAPSKSSRPPTPEPE
ncbi:hypothetical protein FRB95_010687 [Tulasnella sp. JGI-2019a]|nr:hypothetical protein FRB95_010687 [Tulasnella sp. JGI-2019a]